MSMKKKGLTDSELLIMKVIWDESRDDMTLPEIVALVNERFGKDWKPQTVSTFLAKLVKKNFLEMYRQGRLFCYKVLIPVNKYKAIQFREFVTFWNCGDINLFVEDLANNHVLTKDQEKQFKAKVDVMF